MRTVQQCRTCPWRADARVEDIPNYSPELHEGLRATVCDGLESLRPGKAMACHYAREGSERERPCAGWLHNQMINNNIGVRLQVIAGGLPAPRVDGEQRETFDETFA